MDVTHVLINEWKYQTFEDEQTTRTCTRTRKKGSYAWTSTFSESNHECKEKDTLQLSCSVSDVNDININIQSPKDEDIVLSYSRTKGFLLLPQDVQQMHNISSQYLVISKNDANVSDQINNLTFSDIYQSSNIYHIAFAFVCTHQQSNFGNVCFILFSGVVFFKSIKFKCSVLENPSYKSLCSISQDPE